MPNKPTVLISSNRKGGCWKTSGTFALAGEFSRRGKRCLLIDLDPQASLSQSFFGSSGIEELKPDRTVAALYGDSLVTPESLIYLTMTDNIAICPACEKLSLYNHAKPAPDMDEQHAIAEFVGEVGGEYDIVLVDTPPNLGLLTWSGMAAASWVITPLIPEDYAAQGLVHVRRFIEEVGSLKNPKLQWMGLLLTMVQKKVAIHQAYEEKLRETYEELVFETKIPYATVFKECLTERTPITLYKPRVQGAKAVVALVDEVEARAGLTVKNEEVKEEVELKEAA